MSDIPARNLPVIFGETLRQQRLARAISQEELAHKANLDRTFVSRIERGIRQPTISTLFGLAQALGVPPERLIEIVATEWRSLPPVEEEGGPHAGGAED
ncbi:transcriptional regulator [Bordetella ansorpii]|uniref:Transcriptional regulator n=1 Tax=Bordetella ansorpii TaxID=288768 RepID=A0A157RGW9_9BORD|nr:helix-turn-helix transcriptional regulator [Bordetella ansorpii]SAI57176.1 transcriptional regulator [Bordetella ansorpii]